MNFIDSTFCLLYRWAEKDQFNSFGPKNSAVGGLMILLIINFSSIALLFKALSSINLRNRNIKEYHILVISIALGLIINWYFTRGNHAQKIVANYKENPLPIKKKGIIFILTTAAVFIGINLIFF